MRPLWTRNATDYSEIMDSFTSKYLAPILPDLVKEIGPNIPIDINWNSYLVNTADKNYLASGENSFSIKDNVVDLVSTLSFELIGRVPDEKRGQVWKLFRSGYAKVKLGFALK